MRVTSAVGGGNFDIRGTKFGGGMLLFIPVAIVQSLGWVLYEVNPTIPFIVMSGGMVLVTIRAYLRVKHPRSIEK